MKIQRGLSGVYFRSQLPSGKWDAVVFEDLSEEEQDRILNSKDPEWIKELCKILANTINRVGDQFDIISNYEDETSDSL